MTRARHVQTYTRDRRTENMKIVADTNIPFLKGVLEPYAEVVYMDGRSINHEAMIDADAIIIRTRTKCNEETLSGTRVQMIASATIGMDHIDLPWCAEHGIDVQNAEGCNAGGVADYVFSALYGIASRRAIKLDGATIGIVGVGNVGKKVEAMARSLGFNVLLCDPPRAKRKGPMPSSPWKSSWKNPTSSPCTCPWTRPPVAWPTTPSSRRCSPAPSSSTPPAGK